MSVFYHVLAGAAVDEQGKSKHVTVHRIMAKAFTSITLNAVLVKAPTVVKGVDSAHEGIQCWVGLA